MKPADSILLEDIEVLCSIGILENELREKQPIIINVEINLDISQATRSDNIEDALDYSNLYEEILSLIDSKHFNLLESLASDIADLCLSYKYAHSAEIKVQKPEALEKAKAAAVRIRKINN